MLSPRVPQPRILIYLLTLSSGLAALSWEVIWQIKASLALGVSAWGTAITLVATMGGMGIGSLLMGRALQHGSKIPPLKFYAALEIIIGLSGCLLSAGFAAVAQLDSWVYAATPAFAPLAHVSGIVLVLGIPTLCMGATVPVFGLVARQYGSSIALLYGLNTLGAALGALVAAFILLPLGGIQHSIFTIAAINLGVGLAAYILAQAKHSPVIAETIATSQQITNVANPTFSAQFCVAITGFSTFLLQVAWFRSLTAAFQSTTSAFAIMLSALLLALGIAAAIVPILKKMQVSLGMIVGVAGALILIATPLVERFDLIPYRAPPLNVVDWFVYTLLVIGPPVALLGVALPWLLSEQYTPRQWSRLYTLNTLSAIFGALTAAWLLLPTIGFARTAWIAGTLVIIAGLVLSIPRQRWQTGALGIIALIIAIAGESGVGRTHVQGWVNIGRVPQKILEYYEGPEATVSAIAYTDGNALVINGFVAATEFAASHYMPWMGHLPMIAHPSPKQALVICFGTGRTANAVRQETLETVDIVDINARVFKLAHNFPLNEAALDDKRVHPIVMDGRAYLRRTTKIYDVITLEPMPPTFAGVNALYAQEFYQQAADRLAPDGIIAQWLPFHLVSPPYGAAIARTFQSVFPNSLLWIDPISGTGILLGSKSPAPTIGTQWPGFARTGIKRDLSETEVRSGVRLTPAQMQRYGQNSIIVSDDNQVLSYGAALSFVYGGNSRFPNEAYQQAFQRAAQQP